MNNPLSHTIEETEREFDYQYHTYGGSGSPLTKKDFLKSFLRASLRRVLEGVRGEIEDRVNLLTNGSYISDKERGKMCADVQHAHVVELRFISSLIEGEMEKLK